MSEPDASFNPFPGLRPFEADETHLFFGREGQTDELLKRLRSQRFVAVVGTSGSGKSSLVRAGLLPAICGGFMVGTGSAWRMAVFRPGNNPLGQLATALTAPEVFGPASGEAQVQRRIVEMTLRRSSLGLIEVTQQARMAAQENLLVVVDQFEELFRFKRDVANTSAADEAAAFVRLLLEAAQQAGTPIYIVITMRSDYLGDCAEFRNLPETINDGLYLIPRMTRDQRREAITGPVAVGGGQIAPRLVNRLLNDGGENPDQLPILQHALMRTWDRWGRDHAEGEPLDLRHYEAVGGMAEALSRQADEAFEELGDERRQNLAERAFKRLTEKGPDNREIRRACTFGELCEVTGASADELAPVIDTFRHAGRCFLMPPADHPLTADSLVDISHESLIRGWGRLRRWVDEEAASVQIYRRLAETAALFDVGQAGLWRDPDLKRALEWREKAQPRKAWAARYHARFDEAIRFLDQSQAERDREVAERQRQRRYKRLLIQAVFATLLLASIVSWLFHFRAVEQRTNAEKAEKRALAQKEIAQTEVLRVRKQLLDDNTLALSLLDRLIEISTPEERPLWRGQKASVLSQLGRRMEAIAEYEAARELAPHSSAWRLALGYEHNMQGDAAAALAENDAFLLLNPRSYLAHQNRAFALALLGRFEEAEQSFGKAIDLFQPSNQEYIEGRVSPDIEQATRRRVLFLGEQANRTANFLGLVWVKAAAGRADFQQAYEEGARQPKADEAALIVVNWTWLHLQKRPEDYGTLAAQGAMWELAGFPEWAKTNYLVFQWRHREAPQRTHDVTAAWVEQRLARLAAVPLPAMAEQDRATLEIAAWEQQLSQDLATARRSIESALKQHPNEVSLLLRHADLSYSEGRYAQAIADCDAVLKRNPKSSLALLLRSRATRSLNGNSQSIEADLRAAIQFDPSSIAAMYDLSSDIKQRDPVEARRLIERCRSINPDPSWSPYLLWQLAQIHRARGEHAEALRAMETVISMKPDESLFYPEWVSAVSQGKTNAHEAMLMAQLYERLGDARMATGQHGMALDRYWHGLEAIADWPEKPLVAESTNANSIVTKISALVAGTGSPAKAVEFWQAVAKDPRFLPLEKLVRSEIARLIPP